MWVKVKFDFVYMFYMDDDYFLCLDKFKLELYYRLMRLLVWGFYYCVFWDIIYVDEVWIVFFVDVIECFFL